MATRREIRHRVLVTDTSRPQGNGRAHDVLTRAGDYLCYHHRRLQRITSAAESLWVNPVEPRRLAAPPVCKKTGQVQENMGIPILVLCLCSAERVQRVGPEVWASFVVSAPLVVAK